MRIAFLIRSLGTGGAERQLIELTQGLKLKGIEVNVITLYGGGTFRNELMENGINIFELQKKSRWDMVSTFFRLLKVIRKINPDILHGYAGVPNIIAIFVKSLNPDLKVIWGIRSAYKDLSRFSFVVRFLSFMETVLSRHADLIISNSIEGKKVCIYHGFPDERIVVIPNGIDVNKFHEIPDQRRVWRNMWGVADDECLIGIVARFAPVKGHDTFLRASSLLTKARSDIKIACIGSGSEDEVQRLKNLATELGLNSKVIWTGSLQEMPGVYNALDVLCSSSYAEGFSNVIAEAMACNIPCVVTDVGDSAMIVGDTGVVVPAGNPDQLAQGLKEMLDRPKLKIRDRIVNHFTTERLVEVFLNDVEHLV